MAERKVLRCAIYTRKSTEYGLEQDFNSLDAQRESCEAYVKSQSHEGWKLLPAHFDDGGISGATLERPALQTLLNEVKARKIDIIVVYKVDRLTRSLADFAKLVELFDGHGVSFVSVTQQFNTTTSMGRLTLNVLLSFAQFEREVTAERIRDKIAASKQKGLWMGGPAPLGYIVKDKRLVVDETEAEQVRLIFRQYLRLPSIAALAEDLQHRGVVTKVRKLSSGKTIGGIPFYLGPLAYLLKNRLYVGLVVHKGNIYKGQQDAILDRQIFEAVQKKLSKGSPTNVKSHKRSDALLKGKIFDDAGNRMSPVRTQKGALHYRFYVSAPWKGKKANSTASRSRISAPTIERQVAIALRSHRKLSVELCDRQVVEAYLQKVVVQRNGAEIHFLGRDGGNECEASENVIICPFESDKRKSRRDIIASRHEVNDPSIGLRSESHKGLIAAIAKGRRWADELLSGMAAGTDQIAAREKCSERYVRDLLVLASLSPDFLKAAIENRLPPHLIMTRVKSEVPLSWTEQRHRYHLG